MALILIQQSFQAMNVTIGRGTGYRCKHFFAVFTHIPRWSFEKLPGSHKNSPFLTVDELVSHAHQYSIKADHPDCPSFDLNTDVFHDSTLTSRPAALNDLPQKKTNHRTEAARSHEILGQLKNLTYIAEGWQDVTLLQKLKVPINHKWVVDDADGA